MEESRKLDYELPVTEVIEFIQEGLVCVSGEIPIMDTEWELIF